MISIKKLAIYVAALTFVGTGCTTTPSSINHVEELAYDTSGQLEQLEERVSKLEIEVDDYKNRLILLEGINEDSENELVLIQYKIDSDEYADLRDQIGNSIYQSPQIVCSNIVANKTTRNNIYYMVLDDLNDLKNEYGEYSETITYIDNNLNGLTAVIQVMQDECLAAGYSIPTR